MIMATRGNRKIRSGKVITRAGDKTIGVIVERRVRHSLYGKEMKVSRKIIAHDETNRAQVGDVVRVMEVRPISRTKRWRLVDVVAEGSKAGEA
jgi:small subunit ribosomal protein S17